MFSVLCTNSSVVTHHLAQLLDSALEGQKQPNRMPKQMGMAVSQQTFTNTVFHIIFTSQNNSFYFFQPFKKIKILLAHRQGQNR